MKTLFTAIFLLSATGFLYCSPTFSPVRTIHDFGAISANSGGVLADFEFTNSGDSPLTIRTVTTSCGCTEVQWPAKPIPPGKSGTIRVTYTPDANTGPFMKQIDVAVNSGAMPLVLRVKGSVKPAAWSFGQKAGALAIGASEIQLGAVHRGLLRTTWIPVRNTGSRPLTITTEGLPIYARIDAGPVTLAPGAEGRLFLQFDSRDCPKALEYDRPFELVVTDGTTTEKKTIRLRFTLVNPPAEY
jgi:hypothetical protein